MSIEKPQGDTSFVPLKNIEKELFESLKKAFDEIPVFLLPSLISPINNVFKKIMKIYTKKADDELKRQSELIMNNFIDFLTTINIGEDNRD
jgi:hypothetical protein